jgi:hypothetical protein
MVLAERMQPIQQHIMIVAKIGKTGLVQVLECLPSKCEAVSSSPSNTKKKKKKIDKTNIWH